MSAITMSTTNRMTWGRGRFIIARSSVRRRTAQAFQPLEHVEDDLRDAARTHERSIERPLPSSYFRALRRLLRRYSGSAAYVFTTEAGRATDGLGRAEDRGGPAPRPRCRSRSTPTCCGTRPATSWPTTARTRGRSSTTSATRTSSTRRATRTWRPTGSRRSGGTELRGGQGCRRSRLSVKRSC